MKNEPYIARGKLTGLVGVFLESLQDNPPKDVKYGFWTPKQWLEYFTEWLNQEGRFVLVIPGFKPDESDE